MVGGLVGSTSSETVTKVSLSAPTKASMQEEEAPDEGKNVSAISDSGAGGVVSATGSRATTKSTPNQERRSLRNQQSKEVVELSWDGSVTHFKAFGFSTAKHPYVFRRRFGENMTPYQKKILAHGENLGVALRALAEFVGKNGPASTISNGRGSKNSDIN